MDIKGIACYVAIVLCASYAVEAAIVLLQLPLAVSYALLAVPAVAACVASLISPSTAYRAGALWPIGKMKSLRMAFVIPLAFAAFYAIAIAVGYVKFDSSFGELMGLLPPPEQMQFDPSLAPIMPAIFALMGLVLSIVLGPTTYAVIMLGNEYGWRGYLLPRLLPLGRWPAYIITGALWSISLLPIVVLTPDATPLADTLRITGLMIALSILLGEVWRRSRNLSLTAICSGCCICQATTVWTFAVVGPTTMLPYAAGFDEIAIAAIVFLALATRSAFGSLEKEPELAPAPAPAPEKNNDE